MTQEAITAATMQQLRVAGAEKAKAMGMPTSQLRTQWKREQIEIFLLTGEVPVIGNGGVNTDKGEIAAMLVDLLGQLNGGVDPEQVRAIVIEEVAKQTRRVEVVRVDGMKVNVGLVHQCFDEVLIFAQCRIDVMLVGPAGSGKTTTCHKVADALNFEFYAQSVGAQTTKSDLIGFQTASGSYAETILYTAYKNGGVYLLDEVDAGNANVLTSINALMANGSYRFPNGEYVERHADFIMIAAGNTFGRGANRSYVGRNQLDAATLDRFCVVEHDYDEVLEKALCSNDAWCKRVQAYRKAADDLGERVVISPRASMKGAQMLKAGMKLERVEETVIWKGMDANTRSKIVARAC